MSKKRHSVFADPEAGVVVCMFSVSHVKGSVTPPQAVNWDQLIFASQGIITVNTSRGSWVVPPQRAVWVPAGIEHRIEMSSPVSLRMLYFRKGVARAPSRDCCVVSVTPLLRELILHASRFGALNRRSATQNRLIGVILDQLGVLPTVPLWLPMPSDSRAQEIAALLMANPGQVLTTRLLEKAGTSQRTVERLFVQETGLTLGRWRQQVRLLQALRLLAADESVTAVALAVGYESTSAFIAMFKRAFGATPSRYFERRTVRSALPVR
jgi:AraC-like DNA-binding protein